MKKPEYKVFPHKGNRVLRSKLPVVYVYQVDLYEDEFKIHTEYFYCDQMLNGRDRDYIQEVFLEQYKHFEPPEGEEYHPNMAVLSVCFESPTMDYIWATFD